ncbi:MAG: TPR end-of-group domain-containing protein [Acidobacteriota bacterium]
MTFFPLNENEDVRAATFKLVNLCQRVQQLLCQTVAEVFVLRIFFYKRTAEGFRKAIECFEQAIKIDSEYALPVSGLADCYTFLGFYEVIAPAEAKEQVRVAAFKALALDDTLAETHTSFAFYQTTYEWNFSNAEKHFKRALELNPKYALNYHLHAANLILTGHNDDAVAATRSADELEPFTIIFNAALGYWYYLGRRYDKAIAQSLKTIEIAPNHFFARWVLGLTYGRQGRYEEAIAALQHAEKVESINQAVKGDLGRTLAESGRRDEAMRVLEELNEQSKSSYVSPVNLAKIYVGLGEREQVFAQIEQACDEHSIRLPWLMVDPALDDLRSDPRFEDLLRRVGLPQERKL